MKPTAFDAFFDKFRADFAASRNAKSSHPAVTVDGKEMRRSFDHAAIDRWVQHYAPEMERRLRWQYRPRSFAGSWRVDESYMKDLCLTG